MKLYWLPICHRASIRRGQSTIDKLALPTPSRSPPFVNESNKNETHPSGQQLRCAFLTMEQPEAFVIYDHLAADALSQLGWEVIDVPWTLQRVDWSDFDVVIIRSPWDYQHSPEQFMGTLAAIEASSARLLNPLSICRWNMSKTYLRDLEDRGVPIVPSAWPQQLNDEIAQSLFEELASDRIVVKPIVGANASDTFPLHRHRRDENWQQAMVSFRDRPLIAQPFVDSVVEVGEYSLFYFDGCFSHAILKSPCEGDFRVQEEHGGQISSVLVQEDLQQVGQRAIEAIGETLLYARVDLVRLEDHCPALMELELIEPSLYFSFDDDSSARFAAAVDLTCRDVI